MVGEEKKSAKGGFRATLALFVSIVALIVALFSLSRTMNQAQLHAEIETLKGKIGSIKKETAQRVDQVLQETGKGLERLSKEIQKRGE